MCRAVVSQVIDQNAALASELGKRCRVELRIGAGDRIADTTRELKAFRRSITRARPGAVDENGSRLVRHPSPPVNP